MAKKRKVEKSEAALKKPSNGVTVDRKVDYDDEEELLRTDETIISASEDEGGSDDERKHRKLLDAISSLDGKKRRKLAERSEASAQVSEFSISAEGAGDKITLSDLIGTIEQSPSVVTKTKKQLKNLQSRQDTLELPLSRQQTEKIQREVAYGKTAKEVSRWHSVVVQNQKAEQLVFPLNQEPSGPKRVEQVVAGWKAQTPLEQEIFTLLHMNKQPVNDPVLTPMEEASLKAMSLEEAKIRRAELQKARVLQSYYEAKAKREKKIKSKKYHKVLKKAKRKEFLKEFEELRKTDPAAALEELQKMELSRMEERMSLKHQNSGKWAKSKAIMAKYDHEARKAMQQQLEMNKELTQKLVVPSESEEEEGPEEETDLPDFVNEAQPTADPSNPWMMGKLTAEPVEPGEGAAAELLAGGAEQQDKQEDGEEEEDEDMEETLLREFEERRKLRQSEDGGVVPVMPVEREETVDERGAEAAAGDISEDEEEEEEVSEFNSLFQKLVEKEQETTAEKASKERESVEEREEPALLDEGLERLRTLEDVELLSKDISAEVIEPAAQSAATAHSEGMTDAATPQAGKKKKKKKKKMIDCNEVLTKEAKVIKVPLAPTAIEEEEENEEEQKMIIKEAFAGDDVVSDFLKDKRKQEEAGKPKVVDLTLPGWGEWGGVGLQPSRKKRRRFRVKVAPPPPRRDEKLPNVIISEKRNSSVTLHQVNQLPFPFENPTQFESSIRTPVGHTWNTQRTVQKLTAPKVVTQLGGIIEPIAREDFIQGKTQAATGKLPDIELSGSKGKGPQRKGNLKHSQLKKRKNKRQQKQQQQQANTPA
ncbi:U3 small nucleolar RNA-associated protein 14 homolog A [Megalops cyprinoides]|uniref:U3 small nucleolar RNA-associated protein 14 homolog A n=1 Tax=Megalops cyprinoides TaxID=118141 RepID=UPI001864CC4D|nr:U3 small nucleolar RNA-associated protein 14 homolog A [Megalops cyprinoides]